MAINNFNRLFSSPFYIDGKYAEGYVPLLINVFKGTLNAVQTERKPSVNVEMYASDASQSSEGSTSQQVAIVSIKTPIIKFDDYWIGPGTRSIFNEIQRLDQDPGIAGIVLDIDSGGGQVYGTPEFYDNLKSIQKPLVAYTDGLMCSAAYYIGAATNFVIANKRADAIGSIGAYAQFFDFSGFWEKNGAKMHTVYADQSTEKNKGYRDVLEGNYKTYITESLNPTVTTFIQDMKAMRPNLSEEVFKGGTWTGPEALKRNLVDALGSLQDAVAKVFELSTNTKSQNTMSKPNSFPNLEATLGLEAPLAVNDNGSYLNEEQKQSLENTLSANATALKNAQDAQAKAEADLQAEKDAKAAAEKATADAAVAHLAALKAAATEAGVEDLAEDASAEDVQAALTAKIQELNKKPGAQHTTTAAEEEEKGAFDYLDFDNSIYAQLKQS